MSALAEDLLDDLDDDFDEVYSNNGDQNETNDAVKDKESGSDDSDSGEDNENDVDDNDIINSALLQKAKERHALGSLRASGNYTVHLGEIQTAFSKPVPNTMGDVGLLEDDPEYKLVVSCNRIAQDIDEEMEDTYLLITEIYSKKFPELEALISNKLNYVKTVIRIGNEMDTSTIQLNDLLPSAVVMIIAVAGSTTIGKPLSETDWGDCLKACNEMLFLDSDKQTVLAFVESRMQRIAPNLVSIVGSRVAAQLVGHAGGIIALSKIPACNVEVLGHDKRNLMGLSALASKSHYGVLVGCDLVQACAGKLQRKCIKVVAAKVTLAARIDSYKNHNDGSEGTKLRRDLDSKIEKWAEPDKARTKKALPVPEEKKKSRRAGKRVRKIKERYAMTEIRAQHNKVSFTLDGGEYGDSAMGFDTGLSGIKDTGKLRAPQVKKKEIQLSKKMKKAISSSAGQVNGLSSSIVQTTTGGFELRPNAAAERVAAANNKWFAANSGFMSAIPN